MSEVYRIANLYFHKSSLSGWHCTGCDSYKDILDRLCGYCTTARPPELDSKAVNVRLRRSGLLHFDFDFNSQSYSWSKSMDDRQVLHARFYNEERKKIKDKTDDELELWLEEMSSIAFEARSRVHAIQDEVRERKGSKTSSERNLLQKSDSSFDSQSTIGTVKERAKRMSKEAKLMQQMSSLLGVKGAEELIGTLEINKFNPEKADLNSRLNDAKTKGYSELCRIDGHKDCRGSFRVGETSHKCTCSCHAEPLDLAALFPNDVQTQQPEPSSDFNPDDLFK